MADFLTHGVDDNLSSSVIDKLTLPTFYKLKIFTAGADNVKGILCYLTEYILNEWL